MLHQTKLPFAKAAGSTPTPSRRPAVDRTLVFSHENPGSQQENRSSFRSGGSQRSRLKDIADSTLSAIEVGHLSFSGKSFDLDAKIRFSNHNTCYYTHDVSPLSSWASNAPSPKLNRRSVCEISVLETSTLDGARLLHDSMSSHSTSCGRIALLNFASATRPGGGFLTGAQAQEESIARSSTLYPSLMTDTAQQFYKLHGRDRQGGYYYHAMIYSPGIVILKDDKGDWASPFDVDILTCAAVNAGDVRTKNAKSANPVDSQRLERRIDAAMRERMARILFLFEQQGAKNLVLGSFGTGVFKNDIEVVARIWADLLISSNARYKHSFDRIVFAILGHNTFTKFKDALENRRINRTHSMDVDAR
ncbi:hypothetical protein SCLCIDRAFT_117820 [Scleroderma citrinum Foug A]|uniref:Microbial-type PARG catalytic domain-containing protein n=1 Tax=Scleroderma citrinum Foug A TaxID=1036808 RepID=A0A0C3E5C1_9AGAM|nr:hypothetical protein SCLCIDRAFT_117820 [Scleroderma citrinum Foug A]